MQVTVAFEGSKFPDVSQKFPVKSKYFPVPNHWEFLIFSCVSRPLIEANGTSDTNEIDDWSGTDPVNVMQALDQVFGANLSGVKVHSVCLSSGDEEALAVLYVVYRDLDPANPDEDLERQLRALSELAPVVTHLVSQAIFFAAASTSSRSAEEIAWRLQRLLRSGLELFGPRQSQYLQGVLHPVLSSTRGGEVGPIVKGLEDSPNERTALNAITIAKEIRFKSRLAGSLREEGAPMLVEVFPRVADGAGAQSYFAVAKISDRPTVLKEQQGLVRMWGYYEKIGSYLPQSPLHFPYAPEDKPVRFVVVTPHLGNTKSLFAAAGLRAPRPARSQTHRLCAMQKRDSPYE